MNYTRWFVRRDMPSCSVIARGSQSRKVVKMRWQASSYIGESGAPVFGVDGRLIAVLDVSAIDPELSERAHALTGALTVRSARAIEERFFREQFRREWIVAVAPPEGGAPGMLLAIDGNQRIVGANRAARTSLLLDDRGLRAGISLWTIFERDPGLFRRKDRADLATRLLLAGGNDGR